MMTVWTGLLPESGAAEDGPESWSGGAAVGCAGTTGWTVAGGAAAMAGGCGSPEGGNPPGIGVTGALEITGIVVITRGGGLAA